MPLSVVFVPGWHSDHSHVMTFWVRYGFVGHSVLLSPKDLSRSRGDRHSTQTESQCKRERLAWAYGS